MIQPHNVYMDTKSEVQICHFMENRKMKNILLISHYAGSNKYGMEYRAYYLAREWVKRGYHITIAAASYSHLRQINPSVDSDYSEEWIEGIRYLWFKTPKYSGTITRVINMIVFLWKIHLNVHKLAEDVKPDVVVATSVYLFDIYPAKKIAEECRAKLCYEVHDLWPLSPMEIGGYSKWHPFIMALQKAEDYSYKHADKVISMLWNSEEHMKERGLSEGKFKCIPNGFTPEDWNDEKINQPLPTEHESVFTSLADKTVVGFSGGFAISEPVYILVEAAVAFKKNEDLHFVLVGRGPEKAHFEKIISDNNLRNVSILPSVPKHMVPSVIKHFDICFMGGVHSKLHKYGTSFNKLTDYMLSAKPIIQSVDEPGSIVERCGCGIRIEAENVNELIKAIDHLYRLSKKEKAILGKKGQDYARTHLSWSMLAEDFINVFKNE